MTKIFMTSEALRRGNVFLKTLKENSFHVNDLILNGNHQELIEVTFFQTLKKLKKLDSFLSNSLKVSLILYPVVIFHQRHLLPAFQIEKFKKTKKKDY